MFKTIKLENTAVCVIMFQELSFMQFSEIFSEEFIYLFLQFPHVLMDS